MDCDAGLVQECAELRGFSLQQEVCRGRGAQASGVQSGQGLGPGQLFSTDMLAMFDTCLNKILSSK